ncbi:hypothetical protein BJ875DRAFT_157184 [Amylocarpus encephaloides]|uniref:FAD-binding PCMH-type domain-containing protein n=1 Tax=Amylocarpus encephaloides TaxID=45428 RepID=A0A9P8C8J3_9HELO|nr:hypothetical protein BJ875DRAFT_157184 [Amylocarpus encephaloides]
MTSLPHLGVSRLILACLCWLNINAVIAAPKSTAKQCSKLSLLLPSKVSYPASPSYLSSIQSYFWQQSEALTPACIVTPTSTLDVSIIVGTLTVLQLFNPSSALFSVRGGGHGTVVGAANNNGGVTIDMSHMNSTTLSPDKSIAFVGAGARWNNVFAALEPLNLTVSGGRVAGIGTGGFLTGGGISFFSPEYGWACDRIAGMEVVIAGGVVLYVTRQLFPDLFSVLQGGSNNFGIVTRFDLKTFEQGLMSGGVTVYDVSTVTAQLDAFMGFMNPATFDKKATVIQAFVWQAAFGPLITIDMEYALPELNPPALQPFSSIQPQYQSSQRIAPLSELVTELASFQPSGSRGLYANTVLKPTFDGLKAIYDIWNCTIDSISGVDGIVFSIIYQRVPTTLAGNKNSLGLPSDAGSLVLVELSISWNSASDDTLVATTAKNVITAIENYTKAAGLYNKFKYLNYADSFQEPLSGYGASNLAKMKAASKKYDPLGVFQKAAPGGFKLM